MVMGRRFHYGHAKLNLLMKNFIQPADFNTLSPLYHVPYFFKIIEHVPPFKNSFKGMRSIVNFLKVWIYISFKEI